MEAYYTDENGNRTKLEAAQAPVPLTDQSPAGAEFRIRDDHLEVRKGFKGPFKAGRRGLPS